MRLLPQPAVPRTRRRHLEVREDVRHRPRAANVVAVLPVVVRLDVGHHLAGLAEEFQHRLPPGLVAGLAGAEELRDARCEAVASSSMEILRLF